MKALIITRFGGPDVLEIQDVSDPHAGPDQALVNVEAGGLNFADLLTARGGYPGTPKPPIVAGREFAGTEASSGRRVMGYTQWSAFAEKTAAQRALLWPVPDSLNPEQAAAFPVNFFTAYFAFWKAGLIEKPAASSPARRGDAASAGQSGPGGKAASCAAMRRWDDARATRASSRRSGHASRLGGANGLAVKSTVR